MHLEQLLLRSGLWLLARFTAASLISFRSPEGISIGKVGEVDQAQSVPASVSGATAYTPDFKSGTDLFARNYCICSSPIDQHAVDAAVLDLIQRLTNSPIQRGVEVWDLAGNTAAFAWNGAVGNDHYLTIGSALVFTALGGIRKACGQYSGACYIAMDSPGGSTDAMMIGYLPAREDRNFLTSVLSFGSSYC